MALAPGTQAPDFTLTTKTADGFQRVTLSQELAKGPVVLLFVPMAFSGFCTQELCDVTNRLNDYSGLGAQVLGIAGDGPFALGAWAEKEKIGMPLLSDYEHAVAKAYGVAYDSFLPDLGLGMSGVAKRSAFVINREGNIVYVESSDDPSKLPDLGKLQEALKGL